MFILDTFVNQLNENASKSIGNIDSRSLLLECGFYDTIILNENTFTDKIKELFSKFKEIMKQLGRKIATAVNTMINKVKSIFTKKSIETKKKIKEAQKENNKKDSNNKIKQNYNLEISNKYVKPALCSIILPKLENFNGEIFMIINNTIENSNTIDELKNADIEIKNNLRNPMLMLNYLKMSFKAYIDPSFYENLVNCDNINYIVQLIHQTNLSKNDKLYLRSKEDIEGMIRVYEDYVNDNNFGFFTDIMNNIDQKLLPSLENEINKNINILEKYSNQIFKNTGIDPNREQEFIEIINDILNELTLYKSKIPQLASYIIQIVTAIYTDYEYSLKEASDCIKIMKQYLNEQE